MDTHEIYNAVSELRGVLEAEREALRTGRAQEAAGLVNEKMDALKAFDAIIVAAQNMPDRSELRGDIEGIVSLARENASHFTAVRNGMSNAISRLNSLSDTSYVGSYTASGAKTPFPKAAGGYVKKV